MGKCTECGKKTWFVLELCGPCAKAKYDREAHAWLARAGKELAAGGPSGGHQIGHPPVQRGRTVSAGKRPVMRMVLIVALMVAGGVGGFFSAGALAPYQDNGPFLSPEQAEAHSAGRIIKGVRSRNFCLTKEGFIIDADVADANDDLRWKSEYYVGAPLGGVIGLLAGIGIAWVIRRTSELAESDMGR